MRMGPWEIALVLAIILIVFGIGKLPQVGSALGKGLNAFRKGQQGEDSVEIVEESKTPPAKKEASKKAS